MDNQTFYPATNDVVFKAVFGSDKKILMGFLNQVIGLEIASPDDIEVINPEIPTDYADWKQSRLDIRAKTNDEQVNIEMQVESMDYYAERTIIYQSKMITDDRTNKFVQEKGCKLRYAEKDHFDKPVGLQYVRHGGLLFELSADRGKTARSPVR